MTYVTLTPTEAFRRCRQILAQVEDLLFSTDRSDEVANRSIKALMRERSFYLPSAMFRPCGEGKQVV